MTSDSKDAAANYCADTEKKVVPCTPVPNPKPETIKQVLKAFIATSSVKGASKVIKSDNWCQKITWIITLCIGLGVALYLLVLLFSTYFDYPTTVTTRETEDIMPFPDISVCNLSPFSTRQVQDEFATYLNDEFTPIFHSHFGNISLFDIDTESLSYDESNFITIGGPRGYFQNVNRDREDFLKLTLDRFVRACQWFPWKFTLKQDEYWKWDNAKCNVTSQTHVKYFFNQYYGACATFSLNLDVKSSEESFAAIFHPESYGYEQVIGYQLTPDISFGTGVMVKVHPRGTLPDMTNAISAAVGFETTIWADVDRRVRLPAPHGNCSSRDNLPNGEDYKYTYETCRKLCGQYHAMKTCACLAYDEVITPHLREHFDFCGALDGPNIVSLMERVNCSREHYERNPEQDCVCLPPCREWTVRATSSQTVWPDFSHRSMVYTSYLYDIDDGFELVEDRTAQVLVNQSLPWPTPNYELLRENLLKVNVKLNRINVTLTEDKKALIFEQVIGALGGILNLWIGITFVTVVEFGDVLFQLCRKKCNDWRERRRVKTQGPPTKWDLVNHSIKTGHY